MDGPRKPVETIFLDAYTPDGKFWGRMMIMFYSPGVELFAMPGGNDCPPEGAMHFRLKERCLDRLKRGRV